jgi:hypothetical protein
MILSKKIHLALSLLLLGAGLPAVAQNDTLTDGIVLENLPPPKKPRNALFAEVFTSGGLYSFNYDRILFIKERIGTTARAGIFFFPKARGLMEGSVILEPNFLIGNGKFFFETGIGFTHFIIMEKPVGEENAAYKQSDREEYVSVRAGFRIQSKEENGLFFRAGLTPIIYYIDSEGSGWYGQILGGVGFGVSF